MQGAMTYCMGRVNQATMELAIVSTWNWYWYHIYKDPNNIHWQTY